MILGGGTTPSRFKGPPFGALTHQPSEHTVVVRPDQDLVGTVGGYMKRLVSDLRLADVIDERDWLMEEGCFRHLSAAERHRYDELTDREQLLIGEATP